MAGQSQHLPQLQQVDRCTGNQEVVQPLPPGADARDQGGECEKSEQEQEVAHQKLSADGVPDLRRVRDGCERGVQREVEQGHGARQEGGQGAVHMILRINK